MYEINFIVYEGGNLSRIDALKYWRSTHARLVRRVPGIQRYVQTRDIANQDASHPILGIALLAFKDEASFSIGTGSPEFAAAVADLANFADAKLLPTGVLDDPSNIND